jgi:hypothetical protein
VSVALHASADSRHRTASGQPITEGKYLVTPLVRLLENGWFACSVSIRSGSGRGTSDRVVRLTRLFRESAGAAEFAVAEGLQWIASGGRQVRPV